MITSHSPILNLTGVLLSEGVPFLLGLLFVVTILCSWLAYHIAAPIHSIQSAARRVAQGDLSARVPHAVSLRRDELAALAMDFDVERIETLIRTQRNLLTSMSHELRSPLARLNVSLAVMRKHRSQEAFDICERMELDVARIDALIGQLLTLSRLEAGLSLGERANVNFTLLVQEVWPTGISKPNPWASRRAWNHQVPLSWKRLIPSRCEARVKTLFGTSFTSPGQGRK
jgi:signal transduction histidine kinase